MSLIEVLAGFAFTTAEVMNQREVELQRAAVALQAAVAELKGLPFTLGKQTSQYIGMGGREAIQQDFDTPIKESFQGPIANLERATRDAKSVMTEVGKATRFHAVSWWGSVLGLGILLGSPRLSLSGDPQVSTTSRPSSTPFSSRSRRQRQPRRRSRSLAVQ